MVKEDPQMITRISLLSALAAPFILSGAVTSIAAKSPAMEYCSGEWAKMKDAKTIPEGETWPKYWSKCSKDYAAAHPGEATTDQTATAPEENTTTTTKKTKKTKTAAVNEDEP